MMTMRTMLLTVPCVLVVLSGCVATSATAPASSPASKPGVELFGEGVFSTGDYELPPTFTPDGRTAYFSISTPVYGRMRFIVETHRTAGGWSEPVVAPFSGRYDDVDPFLAPGGGRLYFLSKRPLSGTAAKSDLDIWYVERSGNEWGEPRHAGDRVNGPADEHYVTATADGTLYISAVRPDSGGAGDVYRVPREGDGYGDPVNLGPVVNSVANHDTTPFIAPDESYLIFGSRGRADSHGDIDLYVSFRNGDGSWSAPRNPGPRVNSGATDFCPIVSPDGVYLYFASNRTPLSRAFAPPLTGTAVRRFVRSPGNTLADVYRVPLAAVLEAVR
jgi:WD40-like Beta Propeller Repeat